MSHDALIDKLRKLMTLKDRAATEGEAAAAAERLSSLLHRHNIDIGVLEHKEKQQGTESTPIVVSSKIQPYEVIIASAVSLMTDTKYFVRWAGKNVNGKFVKTSGQIVYVGLRDNVDTAVVMYKYLRESVEYMLNERWKKGQISGKSGCRSYRIGSSREILVKCNSIVESRKTSQDNQCTALVLVSNSVAQSYLDNVVKPTGELKSNFEVGDSTAYFMGRADGRNIDPESSKLRRIS